MIIVVSPAKTLDFENPAHTQKSSKAPLLSESHHLMDFCRQQTSEDLQNLMKISEKLALLNVERFQQWNQSHSKSNAKQALFAFRGDVYTGLDADTFDQQDIDFAQQHFRILSGLYGILRPLDLIQPYRLEMGTSLATDRGKNLYQFWGDKVTQQIIKSMKTMKSPSLVNLASNEYFKVIQSKNLPHPVITPVFKDYKNGQYKVISFLAKKARGMMSRFLIQNQIEKKEDITSFNAEGYRFYPKESSDTELVFKRKVSE